jgi:cbb3-type cytochrome oxidase subunit 3
MIQKVLTSIGGVGNYGVIAVVLFFAVFMGVLVWAFGLRRPFLDRMSRLPLESDDEESASLDPEVSTVNRHE